MPLSFDLSVEDLEKYEGTNPCPTDFNEYWEAGLAEINAVDPAIKTEKADVNLKGMDASHLYFTSVKGSRLHAMYISPADKSKKYPVMLRFHGYMSGMLDFFEEASFAGQGYIVLALDCRGQRGRSANNVAVEGTEAMGLIMRGFDDPDPTKLYYRNAFLDTVQLMKVAKSLPHADKDNIYTYGFSQGGGLALACAALNRNDIKKTVAVCPFLCDYKRVWELDLATGAYADIREYLRSYSPIYGKQMHVWEKLGYIDVQHLANRITSKVLWAAGLEDKVCPPSTQYAAFNKIRSDKQIILYSNHGHENLFGFPDKMITFFNT